MDVHQMTLYTLHLHNITSQLYLNKAGEGKEEDLKQTLHKISVVRYMRESFLSEMTERRPEWCGKPREQGITETDGRKCFWKKRGSRDLYSQGRTPG